MPLWRLVLSNIATWSDLKTTWTYVDVMKANAVLDIKEAITEAMTPKTKEK